jgi:hypothetical protein
MPLAAIRRCRGRRRADDRRGLRAFGAAAEAAVGSVRAGPVGNERIPWVLVDNKSAAEIGKRCLLLGLQVTSFGAMPVTIGVADCGDPSP